MVALALTFAALFWASASPKPSGNSSGAAVAVPDIAPTPEEGPAPAPVDLRSKLSRQPEVFKLNRILGQRLTGQRPVTSVITGTLTFGTDERGVSITRRQDNGGEGVEVALANQQTSLAWNAAAGAGKSSGDAPSNDERFIVERLALDSPDQFALAQLRGASYYTTVRNVRPAEVGDADGYAGPTWNIVRVSEPTGNGQSSAQQSNWRLYYINTATGLIDRIVCEIEGDTVTAELSDWRELGGEKIPGQVNWTRQGLPVMQFHLNSFSQAQQ
jgi:hypothetical protein